MFDVYGVLFFWYIFEGCNWNCIDGYVMLFYCGCSIDFDGMDCGCYWGVIVMLFWDEIVYCCVWCGFVDGSRSIGWSCYLRFYWESDCIVCVWFWGSCGIEVMGRVKLDCMKGEDVLRWKYV